MFITVKTYLRGPQPSVSFQEGMFHHNIENARARIFFCRELPPVVYLEIMH